MKKHCDGDESIFIRKIVGDSKIKIKQHILKTKLSKHLSFYYPFYQIEPKILCLPNWTIHVTFISFSHTTTTPFSLTYNTTPQPKPLSTLSYTTQTYLTYRAFFLVCVLLLLHQVQLLMLRVMFFFFFFIMEFSPNHLPQICKPFAQTKI